MARAARSRGRLEEAHDQTVSALELIESERARMAFAPMRATYLAVHRDAYELLVDVLMALHVRAPSAGHDRDALDASERGRARGFLDLLGESTLESGGGRGPRAHPKRARAAPEAQRSRSESIASTLADRQGYGDGAARAENPDGAARARTGSIADPRLEPTLRREDGALPRHRDTDSGRAPRRRDAPPPVLPRRRAQLPLGRHPRLCSVLRPARATRESSRKPGGCTTSSAAATNDRSDGKRSSRSRSSLG